MVLDDSNPSAKGKSEDEFETNMRDSLRVIIDQDSGLQAWGIHQDYADLRLESATRGPPARATFRLFVTPQMSNINNSMHGGCTATLVDVLTSILVIGVSEPGIFQTSGVSRNLNVTYLRPPPVGKEIRVTCEVTQIGKRLVLTRAEIRRVDDDKLCAIGDHQKVNTDVQPSGRL